MKVYVIKVDNGAEYDEEYEVENVGACMTEEKAKAKVSELENSEDFLMEHARYDEDVEDVEVWYEEVDVIE